MTGLVAECVRHMVEFDSDYGVRPYAGSQLVCEPVEGLLRIDDDFVYRQEDFVFQISSKEEGIGKVKLMMFFTMSMRPKTFSSLGSHGCRYPLIPV